MAQYNKINCSDATHHIKCLLKKSITSHLNTYNNII